MSPEQARGAEVDARSDQFAFGLILYELAAHKRAFVRDSAAETMTAIIRDEAEPLPPSVSAPLRWVVERCMAKRIALPIASPMPAYPVRSDPSRTSSSILSDRVRTLAAAR